MMRTKMAVFVAAATATLVSALPQETAYSTTATETSSYTEASTSSAAASYTDSSYTSTATDPVTHTVAVGKAGHTFQPDVTLAEVGDLIGMLSLSC